MGLRSQSGGYGTRSITVQWLLKRQKRPLRWGTASAASNAFMRRGLFSSVDFEFRATCAKQMDQFNAEARIISWDCFTALGEHQNPVSDLGMRNSEARRNGRSAAQLASAPFLALLGRTFLP
jgi:hypothetical protein